MAAKGYYTITELYKLFPWSYIKFDTGIIKYLGRKIGNRNIRFWYGRLKNGEYKVYTMNEENRIKEYNLEW